MGLAIPIIDAAIKVLDKILPDPQAKAQAQIELLRLQQAGEFKELEAEVQLATAQTRINEKEAENASVFVSGWRPALGWVCAAIFAANYIGVPLLAWIGSMYGIPMPPRLEMGEVLPVLLGMLGLGGLRTAEKIKGATK